jgi:hypothetical protein
MRNFLGWKPKYLGSKSRIYTTGSDSDAPLAVSSNYTYILFPGLQLGGDTVTLSLTGCKAFDDTCTNRPGWAELWAHPWHRDLSSRCTLTHPCALGTHCLHPGRVPLWGIWLHPGRTGLQPPLPGNKPLLEASGLSNSRSVCVPPFLLLSQTATVLKECATGLVFIECTSLENTHVHTHKVRG